MQPVTATPSSEPPETRRTLRFVQLLSVETDAAFQARRSIEGNGELRQRNLCLTEEAVELFSNLGDMTHVIAGMGAIKTFKSTDCHLLLREIVDEDGDWAKQIEQLAQEDQELQKFYSPEQSFFRSGEGEHRSCTQGIWALNMAIPISSNKFEDLAGHSLIVLDPRGEDMGEFQTEIAVIIALLSSQLAARYRVKPGRIPMSFLDSLSKVVGKIHEANLWKAVQEQQLLASKLTVVCVETPSTWAHFPSSDSTSSHQRLLDDLFSPKIETNAEIRNNITAAFPVRSALVIRNYPSTATNSIFDSGPAWRVLDETNQDERVVQCMRRHRAALQELIRGSPIKRSMGNKKAVRKYFDFISANLSSSKPDKGALFKLQLDTLMGLKAAAVENFKKHLEEMLPRTNVSVEDLIRVCAEIRSKSQIEFVRAMQACGLLCDVFELGLSQFKTDTDYITAALRTEFEFAVSRSIAEKIRKDNERTTDYKGIIAALRRESAAQAQQIAASQARFAEVNCKVEEMKQEHQRLRASLNSAGRGDSSCFPACAKVHGARLVSSLAIGDSVLGEHAIEDQVYALAHVDHSPILRPFIQLTFANGQVVRLSEKHFVPMPTQMHYAQDVRVGMIGWVLDHDDSLITSQVTGVDQVMLPGLFNPITMSGYLVVDGVLVSCHSDWFLDSLCPASQVHRLPAIYQTILAPARAIYSALKDDVEVKELASKAGKFGQTKGGAVWLYWTVLILLIRKGFVAIYAW